MKRKLFASIAFTSVMALAQAQIPNAGFESWTNMGSYNNPNSWDCLNSMTAPMSVYTCEKGMPGNPGAAYLKLTSKTVAGMGVMPGIAISGTFDQSTMQPLSGFAFNQRPVSLTGNWQHMIFGSSQGFIDVQLTRWDGMMQMRMPVATAHYVLTGMAMNWAAFTIPLTYMDGNYPDSCIITLSASGGTPANNDYLYIDNLAFTGSVTGINDVADKAKINIHPNPATSLVTVELPLSGNSKADVQITDLQGKIVMTQKDIETTSALTLDVSNLPKGYYTVKVSLSEKEFITNFAKK